ncbi:MAG: amidohydrolase [Acidobacteria bacterium]|nr:amidohydrolase [Acidobacteriota bacterium]
MKKLFVPVLLAFAVAACQRTEAPAAEPEIVEEHYTAADFDSVDKVDFHAHIHARDGEFVDRAREDRFRFVNIATHAADPDEMRTRHETVFTQLQAHPDRVVAVVSFPMAGWDDDDWAERTIRYLDDAFEQGAAGVKVWKNIGMEFRDESGDLVMMDDPGFDPIFAHLVEKGIPVIGHLGEPRECWLPVEEMVIHKGYFSTHPEYHMYLHPEMPSYEDQLAARDGLLKRNPELRFAGAHLASLEWSVDELAAFLDRFPGVMVETAARVPDLQYQSSLDREKVRAFMIEYQDRIAYGTDLTVGPSAATEEAIAAARTRWRSDWRYFATDLPVEVGRLEEPVQGLNLPKTVVDKLYRLNAERFFPDAWGPPAS